MGKGLEQAVKAFHRRRGHVARGREEALGPNDHAGGDAVSRETQDQRRLDQLGRRARKWLGPLRAHVADESLGSKQQRLGPLR